MSDDKNEQTIRLLQLVRDAVQQDTELRETYQIGDKFRFIRDRLQVLLTRIEEEVNVFKKESGEIQEILDDEILVYVYLYNAQGDVLPTWQKMLNRSVFYEYSVNRPIYAEKSDIEAYIRSKSKRIQHAYLSMIVKKQDIIPTSASSDLYQDAFGHRLIKVKEGSLNRVFSFTYNGIEYSVNETGEIQKKLS